LTIRENSPTKVLTESVVKRICIDTVRRLQPPKVPRLEPSWSTRANSQPTNQSRRTAGRKYWNAIGRPTRVDDRAPVRSPGTINMGHFAAVSRPSTVAKRLARHFTFGRSRVLTPVPPDQVWVFFRGFPTPSHRGMSHITDKANAGSVSTSQYLPPSFRTHPHRTHPESSRQCG
jgi:hypothetical protein